MRRRGNVPAVSVIIPTYNRAEMVKEAIQSVLEQTYTDYEIVVVDDGSTDNTRDVVNALNRRFNKIRYIYQENKGRSAARNRGIRTALGDYIAFLDSDDRFLPEKLRMQVEVLESNSDAGMVYTNTINVDENGRMLADSDITRRKLSGCIYPELLFIKGTSICTPSVLVRTQVLNEVGVFDETMDIAEDLDLWRRIARQYKVLQIPEPLTILRYRLNERFPIRKYAKARTFYFRKAIAEDPMLKQGIEAKLFSETYLVFGISAIINREFSLARNLFIRSLKISPLLFFKYLLTYSICTGLNRILPRVRCCMRKLLRK